MAPVPVEILLGIYLGILTGIIPAVVSGALGFGFKYLSGVTIPGFAVVVLALAIAGVNGGLLALTDPTVRESSSSITLTGAILVVLMMSLYAHAKGDQMGAAFPRRLSLRALGERTLSTDVIDLVGRHGHVHLTVAGEVEDLEGHPPLPPELRAEISEGEWPFPADLPLVELETRLADTLRTEYDLAEVDVRIDERGKATVAAAPPTSGVSKRVPRGTRAVSIDALVPTGLARGDRVGIVLAEEVIDGTVVSAQSGAASQPSPDPPLKSDGGAPADEPPLPQPRAPVTTGGNGRITVAVAPGDASTLLERERAHVVVRSRGTRREFELLALLRRVGNRFRRFTLDSTSQLAGESLGDAKLRESHDVVVLAVRSTDRWRIAPDARTELAAGDELIVVGTRDHLDRFAEVVS